MPLRVLAATAFLSGAGAFLALTKVPFVLLSQLPKLAADFVLKFPLIAFAIDFQYSAFSAVGCCFYLNWLD